MKVNLSHFEENKPSGWDASLERPKIDRRLQLELFAKAAELGSLSRPAETLSMSNAAASRHLSALEERLADVVLTLLADREISGPISTTRVRW